MGFKVDPREKMKNRISLVTIDPGQTVITSKDLYWWVKGITTERPERGEIDVF